MKLIKLDENNLKQILLQQTKPIMEYDLIKQFTVLTNIAATKDRLYTQHFSLYHALYKLKFNGGNKNLYLHLNPLRIRLLKIPARQQCQYYHEPVGKFCLKRSSQLFCAEHINCHPQHATAVSFDPLFDFYLNPDNITFGNSDLLIQLMDGVKIFAFKKQEIDQALQLFQLTKPTKQAIQNRFHVLARKMHPG